MPKIADALICARWLIPAIPANTIYEHHTLALLENRIIDCLPTQEALEKYPNIATTELNEHVVIPGLINAHGHAAMTLLRGLADDLPLETWLEDHIWPVEARWVSEEFVRDGTLIAIAEMLRSGTSCFSDMYFFPDIAAAVVKSSGIRAQICFPIMEFPTAWGNNPDEYISKGLSVRDEFKDEDRIQFAFGPHAPYTNTDATLSKVSMLAAELDAPVQIHLHETAHEVSESLKQYQMRPLKRLQELNLLSPRLQCVHMTAVDDEDIQMLAESGSQVIHCPESNMKLASGICPVSKLQQAGVNVGLGTDGAASNNDLDLFGELRSAVLLSKVSSMDATALPAHDALRLATLDSAQSLGLQNEIGSLEVGKKADITAVRMNELECLPLHDPCSQLIHTNSGSRVSHVWVDGQLLLNEGQLTTLHLDDLLSKAATWQARIKG